MYGKMQDSGITEIIPLIFTSVIWGRYPVFPHPEFPQGSPAHLGGLQSPMTVTSFFMNMAGNIPFISNKGKKNYIILRGKHVSLG